MDSKRPATRRQIITGQAAIAAAQEAAERAAAAAADRRSPFDVFDAGGQPYLIRFSRPAMATDFQLFLVAGVDAAGAEAAVEALDLIERTEAQLTVYRDASDVMHVNRRAADEAVAVEPGLFALLERADRLYRETGGAYDITSAPLSKAWGFARRAGNIPTREALAAARACVGGDLLALDRDAQTVRFLRPGVEINLNSIGKGYALDRSAEVLTAHGVEHFLWHGGQSSVLARGSERPAVDSRGGWLVGVRHPLRPERRLAEIVVVDQAVGTSGAGFQFFRHEGKRYGHVLDPRTGYPAEGVFSVSVLAPTAAEADALSTAFYVLGFDAATDYCASHPEIGFLMLLPGGGGSTIELATCNLDDRCWRLVDAP